MTRDRTRGADERRLDGILVVAKPAGPTSHDVVGLVRRLSGVRRVGHGGTLDPFATGVLPLFLGNATRLVEYHMADEKAYRAVLAFGARSSTDDLEGELTPAEGPLPDRPAVESALEAFRGRIRQVPPDYSAVKVAGRRAYELARSGSKPELREREVEIRELTLVEWSAADERPTAVLDIRCSAGTYVRALARDLGTVLGSGAYLAALSRTASGPFRLADAHSLDAVRDAFRDGRFEQLLLQPDAGLELIPALGLADAELAALSRGQVVRPRGVGRGAPGPEGRFRIVDGSGRLLAIARLVDDRLHPEKVFSPPGG